MNKNVKALSATIVIFIGLITLSVMVSADSDLYDITKIKVNGIEMSPGEEITTQVELEDSTEIEVFIEGVGNETTCPDEDTSDCGVDVRVRAWIGGYEYEDIEATSNEFTVEPGVSYRKTLILNIPEDLDVDDEENEYTLYVEVFDDDDSEREDFVLFAERPNHFLNIIDVVYDPNVRAGERTPIEVRMENLGDSKEEDIKVQASLAGETAVDYIEELAAFEDPNTDEESSESAKIVLTVPKDLETDYYDLIIRVSYNRGHDSMEETYKVWVEGTASTADEDSEESGEAVTTISISSTDIEGTEEEEKSLTLSFTNTGGSSETYTVNVQGEEQWADAEVSPTAITVGAGDTKEVTVTLTPEEDAAGEHAFSIQILDSDGKLQEEIAMEMDVEEKSGLGDISSALKIGFILLIVLIVIIGIIVAFRKLKDDDDDEGLEPKEGQTYY